MGDGGPAVPPRKQLPPASATGTLVPEAADPGKPGDAFSWASSLDGHGARTEGHLGKRRLVAVQPPIHLGRTLHDIYR